MSDSNHRKPKYITPPSIALAAPKAHNLKPGELESHHEYVMNYLDSIPQRAASVGLRLKHIPNLSEDFLVPMSIMYVLRGEDIVFEGIDTEAFDFIEAEIEDYSINNVKI